MGLRDLGDRNEPALSLILWMALVNVVILELSCDMQKKWRHLCNLGIPLGRGGVG